MPLTKRHVMTPENSVSIAVRACNPRERALGPAPTSKWWRSKKIENEGRTHDVDENKGSIFGTHDVDETK
jgi:hypothetical protein